jgi:ssDNA-binding Zn-finger/Zn-ribbon topoisomerase 1
MTDAYLVCPECERAEPADELAPCPACGSERTYLNHVPAWPDATAETYVKFDAGEAELAGE